MNDFRNLDIITGVSDVYSKVIVDIASKIRLRTIIRILVVVDGSISLTEAPSGFGVGRIVRLLRESHVGCTHFSVDTARRGGGGGGTPTYSGFRFDQRDGAAPLINKYDEIWCFGFNPDNNNDPDSNITHPGALPTSDSELTELTRWMNNGGGLLAMGDHDYLGASMCHRIPRIRSMRRWTNAQSCPPQFGFNRHDTNQPFNPNEMAGSEEIEFLRQEDSLPQKIDWVPWLVQRTAIFQVRKRPHPILCHPTHGPIDVMPDHPHEGWCYENHEINLTAPLNVPGLSGDEYPLAPDGTRPAPTLIAYGTTTPDPPFQLEKGASPKKRFGMISVYDGRPANVGRVATDSTWHHWFDENITEIEAAGGTNWAKISRYYLNVAVWLAPPTPLNWCIAGYVLASHFTYLGFQEYSPKLNIFELGKPLHTQLTRYLGPCWVSSFVLDRIQLVDNDFWAWLKDRLFWKDGVPIPRGDPCLSCPPFELVEIAVMGGLVRSTFPVAEKVRAHVERNGDKELKVKPEDLVELQLEGTRQGLKEFRTALKRSVEELRTLAK